ncbi:hypothetical protein AAZX31_10G071500 [Glycine max]|uniref:GIR1-like zinc ribbon domain-containing protein n=2 Tax=Glycine subgen. Soja TaxID=1462606 RepID=I1L9H2_SOYBN|nr:hypothetical protein JHK87_027119 [Glycine soja]KAG4996418.1 hypothetical protein JHK85_027857 [Glycine max]KAG5003214.1 hypothetical protein JHK86_027353 [Glycine max]KAG5126389.1 hypothetical protein JHK82_027224 [Glycine max]KAG5150992.1 hypothetical protein JHK84_027464 [Glycine max]
MSSRNESYPKLGLDLNLPPPTIVNHRLESPARSTTVLPTSPSNSCVSTELNQDDNNNNNSNNNLEYSNNSEAIFVVLVGCSYCLMYLMVNEGDLKCPKCKSTNLIHFLNFNNIP